MNIRILLYQINESGHNSSAEVTVEDVVNPEDINIYRDLAELQLSCFMVLQTQ
jgi:hypothetical protein